jgi:hypothetical protein
VTIDQLRETLRQLNRLLEAADAKKATTVGLTEFIEATAPFGELSIKAFVTLAEAGRTPPSDRTSVSPRRGATTKTKVDFTVLAGVLKNLYDRAAEPDVNEEQIRTACAQLGALTKGQLVQIAEGVGLAGMKSKKKDELVAEITRRLIERKGAAIRRQLVDRPAGGGTTSNQFASFEGSQITGAPHDGTLPPR